MIGAGAKILGNIEVGKYAKIGANSVCLTPFLNMPQRLACQLVL